MLDVFCGSGALRDVSGWKQPSDDICKIPGTLFEHLFKAKPTVIDVSGLRVNKELQSHRNYVENS